MHTPGLSTSQLVQTGGRVLSVLCASFAIGVGDTKAVEYGQVAAKVAFLLQREHFVDQLISDDISRKTLDLYLNALDPERLFLLQTDIDGFRARYGSTLDDSFLLQDISPAFEIHGAWILI